MPWLSEAASATENRGIVDLATAIEPPAPEEDEPVLGLEDSMAKTMNWIGYEEYEEHLARLAETDQAAFQLNKSGGGGTPPTAQTEPTQQQQEPQPKQTPQSGQTAPPSVTESPQDAPNGAVVPKADKATEADRVEQVAPEKTDPDKTGPSKDGDEGTEEGPKKPKDPTEPNEQPKPKPQPQQEPKPEPQPKPSPNPQPTPGEGPGSGGDEPGEPGNGADQEADPTSVVDVPPEKWRTGKPLAAHGLELQTRRPQFTALDQLSARFGNPVVEIQFARSGRPSNALIIESSGSHRIDGPILDSLYRWRAKGDQLQELKGDETVNIRLRIVLR